MITLWSESFGEDQLCYCESDTASWSQPALCLPGHRSAVTSGRLRFSPTSTAAHQLRSDRCQDRCGSSVLLWETCCHIWSFQRKRDVREEIMQDKSGWKDQKGCGDMKDFTKHLRAHRHVTGQKHQCGCHKYEAPSGWQRDKKGELDTSSGAVF